MTMSRVAVRAGVLAAAAAFVAIAPAAGQTGTGWQIGPRAGVFYPMGSLGNVPISTQIAGVAPEAREARLSAGVAVGVSLLHETSGGATRLRLDADYVPPVDVEVEGYTGNLLVQASVGSVLAGVEQMLTAGQGALQPYVTAALGVRGFSFQPSLSAGPQFPNQQLSPAFRFGGGAVLRVSVLSIGAEVTNQMSGFRFEDGDGRRLLNDLHGLFSIRVGLF
jgi:hypothetical protein